MVLPYLGGLSVRATDRRLRVQQRVAAGWWRFEVSGRLATAQAQVDPPELGHLPVVRGHLVGPWLFTSGSAATHLHLMPEEEAAPLSPATGRRWAGDDVVFDAVAFDDEPEEACRAALLDDTSPRELVGTLKGVVPSLRAAFGYARLLREARSRGIQVGVREVLARVHAIADGTLGAGALLDEIEARIFQADPTSCHRESGREPAVSTASTEERAAAVLDGAGAHFLSGRNLGGDNYEVVFRYLGEQFIAVVDRSTLHVYDSGICLEGHDEELGLDSLPSVIAEAIAHDELYITRR